jgi:hypothetical protein
MFLASPEVIMAHMLFDLLFALALVLPVLAVVLGSIVLLLPQAGLTIRRSLRAHA